jgi:hypothetical protein
MNEHERADDVLERASRGEADAAEIEACIAATRTDLDRNLSVIERRLSPDELIHQAVGYLRDGPTAFFSNLGHTVKTHPVPVALLSVSLGWLMLAGRRSPGAEHADYEMEGGQAWDAARRTGDVARERVAHISERTSRVADRASEFGARARNTASEVGSSLSDRASDVGARTRYMMGHARESVARVGTTVGEQSRHLRDGYLDLVERQPLMLGAIAFAAGAVVAAGLRRTRLEDEAMGNLRDRAVDDAEMRARSELKRGTTAVQSALEGDGSRDSDQTEMTELTPESGEDAARGVTPGQYPHERVHQSEEKDL